MGSLETDREEHLVEYRRLRNDMREIQARIADVTATADSPDGLISVTVVGRGDLSALEIDPRIYRSPDTKALAEAIMGTIREAVEMAERKLFAITREYLPPDATFENTDVHTGAFMYQLDNEIEGSVR